MSATGVVGRWHQSAHVPVKESKRGSIAFPGCSYSEITVSMRKVVTMICGALALSVVVAALAQGSASSLTVTPGVASDPRNFEGLWWPHEGGPSQGPPPDAPPPEDASKAPLTNAAPNAESQLRVVECAPVQQMVIAGGGLASLVFQNRREIVMVAEFGMDYVRTIFLGRHHPLHVSPQPNGHSVGHWEGDTLVVDTIGFADRVGKDRGLHTIERITKVSGGFTDEILVEQAGMPPRQQSVQYDLRPDQQFNEYVCEESFDRYQLINGVLDNPNIPPSRERNEE